MSQDHLDGTDESESPLSSYLGLVFDYRRLIIITTTLFLVLGVLYAFFATPIYRAEMAVQVEVSAAGPSSAATDLLSGMSGLFDIQSQAATEVEIIHSRMVLGRTVDELRLDIDAHPLQFPILGALFKHRNAAEPAPPFLGFGSFAWGGEKINVPKFDVPAPFYDSKWTLVAGASGKYELWSPDGDVIFRGVVGTPAHLAFGGGNVDLTVANLVARPGTRFVLVRTSQLEAIDALKNQLDIAERSKGSGVIGVALQGKDPSAMIQILSRISNAYVQQNAARKASEAENTIGFLTSQMPDLRNNVEQAEAKYTEFRKQKGVISLDQEGKALLDQLVATETTISTLRQQREALNQRFVSGHPGITAINEQIAQVQSDEDRINARLKLFPDLQREELGLLRDVQVSTGLYTGLLNNIEQLKVVRAGKLGNVRVIDAPMMPYEPVKPKKAIVIAIALMAGLMLGIVMAIINQTLTRGVEDATEIERVTKVNVYATVPESSAQTRLTQSIVSGTGNGAANVLAVARRTDIAVESLRSLRTTLHLALADATNNVIMLTGPSPGVGKSFITVNLGALWGDTNKRVLIIDGDLRRGYLHKYFGLERDHGLTDLITGTAEADGVVHREVLPNVDFISTGALPINPSELLASPRFAPLMSELRQGYDLVLIDMPPVLAVADAMIVGKVAATALLVVKFGDHPMREIAAAIKQLSQAGIEVAGSVLNSVPFKAGRSSIGRYRYAYQYRYDSTDE